MPSKPVQIETLEPNFGNWNDCKVLPFSSSSASWWRDILFSLAVILSADLFLLELLLLFLLRLKVSIRVLTLCTKFSVSGTSHNLMELTVEIKGRKELKALANWTVLRHLKQRERVFFKKSGPFSVSFNLFLSFQYSWY